MAVVSTGQITITDVNDYTYQGTTAPKNPIPNVTIWIDTSVTPSVMKRWTGTAWEIVNEVKVGGRNLFRQTLDFSSPWALLRITKNTDSDGFAYVSLFDTWAKYIYQDLSLELGQTYIMSLYAKSAVSSLVIEIKDDANNLNLGYITVNSTNWSLYNFSFVVSSISQVPRIALLTRQNTADIFVKAIKLELGNKATDWTPAPEDEKYIIIAGDVDGIIGLTTNAEVLWEKL